MEKQTDRQKRPYIARLLNGPAVIAAAVFVFFAVDAGASPFSSLQMNGLHLIPDSTPFFTAQESGFTLSIPGVEPSDVQTTLPSLKTGVQFVSSKRDSYVDADGKRGTMIHLWFLFSDSGIVLLPPLTVRVGFRNYHIPFDSVTVYENPATISPVLSVRFDSDVPVHFHSDGTPFVSITAGQKLRFTLYLNYAVQVVAFSWELPKNSLFSELERYDITRGEPRGNGFSADAVPVARFEWEPLVAGHWQLPVIHVTATGYNGARRDPAVPAYDIIVSSPPARPGADPLDLSDSVYPHAFSAVSADSGTDESIQKPEQPKTVDCSALAQLRSAERHSFPWSRVRNDRRRAEQAAGISTGENEPSEPLFFLFLILFGVSLLVTVVLYLFRHIHSGVAGSAVCALFLFLSVFTGSRLVPRYGIFSGGLVRPVPEKDVSSTQSASSGIRVKIVAKAGGWVYIDCADSDGWVPGDTICLIR